MRRRFHGRNEDKKGVSKRISCMNVVAGEFEADLQFLCFVVYLYSMPLHPSLLDLPHHSLLLSATEM